MPLDAISVARTELIALSEAVVTAAAERDEAQRIYDQLSPAGDRLEALVAAHQQELRALIDGSPSELGSYTDRLFTVNRLSQEIAVLQDQIDLGALRAAHEALDAKNVALGQLQARRASAVYRAAVDEARASLQSRATPAMTAGLVELLPVEALAGELRVTGDLEAMSASRAIDQLIVEAKQRIAVRGGVQSARSFLRALTADPHARLLSPQADDVEIVEMAPRTIRGAEDGSQFINRGEPEAEPVIGVSTPFYTSGWRAALSAQDAQNVEPVATASEPEPASSGISALPWEAVPGPTFDPPPPEVPSWLESSSPTFRPSPRTG